MNLVEALKLARELHAGQVDKAGEPYIWHPVRVMLRLPQNANQLAKIAALLHDVIEDCGLDEADLLARGVPPGAARMVRELSRPAGRSYTEFIQRIAWLGGAVAKIKIADIEDNCEADRMAMLEARAPEKAALLADKYRAALRILALSPHARTD